MKFERGAGAMRRFERGVRRREALASRRTLLDLAIFWISIFKAAQRASTALECRETSARYMPGIGRPSSTSMVAPGIIRCG